MKIPTLSELSLIVLEFLECCADNDLPELRLDCCDQGWHITRPPYGPTWGKAFTYKLPQHLLVSIAAAGVIAQHLIEGVQAQLTPLDSHQQALQAIFTDAGLTYRVVEQDASGDVWLGGDDAHLIVKNARHSIVFIFKNGALANMGVQIG